MKRFKSVCLFVLAAAVGACAAPDVRLDVAKHGVASPPAAAAPAQADIPPAVERSFVLPRPKAQAKTETYSVVVSNVPVHELLFSLARDARINVDIHPGIEGKVTLNALDQTLPQLLSRIAKQVDMRFEIEGGNLAVMPDTPFLRHYKIDYVNLTRDTTSSIAVSSQIGSAASTGNDTRTVSSSSGSLARIDSSSKNRFWDTLTQNVKDLLRETDKVFPEGKGEAAIEQKSSQSVSQGAASTPLGKVLEAASGLIASPASGNSNGASNNGISSNESTSIRLSTFREAASVIPNYEAGLLSVRATSRQHEKVQEFLDRVMNSAKRQVLIDVTVAEVQLSHNYQQGIDWSALNLFDTGLKIVQKASGSITGVSSSMAEIDYTSKRGNFASSIKLLDTFGSVKILSSPKLSVLNNQTAVMKVVDDNIYFTYEVDEREATTTTAAKTTIKSTIHSVPVGLVLTITPQVGDDDSVTLNIRPSISRVIGQKDDPSFDFFQTGSTVRNTIPIIRAREFDSVMRVANGNIAVMGGLMEDLLDNTNNSVPGAASTPILGGLFQNHDDNKKKTELVIFVRPTIIRDPSLAGDYKAFRNQLPEGSFFEETSGPRQLSLPEAPR